MSNRPSSLLSYRGRFAPSPTGLLHMGSLVAALGSFLDAKANRGEWLLRIEDIDPPREEEGAKDKIPKQLEAHGLQWDGPITYQSDNSSTYLRVLEHLRDLQLSYRCDCSRQAIRDMGGIYDRRCLSRPPDQKADAAIRLKITEPYAWFDLVQGQTMFENQQLGGDFIIHRKDGLFSYQLAVAVDDHNQGITRVVRGADLLDSTARQALIMRAMGWKPPEYAHLPMICSTDGHKLSKQAHAPILEADKASENLFLALRLLGQAPPEELCASSVQEILIWALEHWHIEQVPRVQPPQ